MTTKTRQPALPLDTILDGDCIEVMRSLPEASVDLIFADPRSMVGSRATGLRLRSVCSSLTARSG